MHTTFLQHLIINSSSPPPDCGQQHFDLSPEFHGCNFGKWKQTFDNLCIRYWSIMKRSLVYVKVAPSTIHYTPWALDQRSGTKEHTYSTHVLREECPLSMFLNPTSVSISLHTRRRCWTLRKNPNFSFTNGNEAEDCFWLILALKNEKSKCIQLLGIRSYPSKNNKCMTQSTWKIIGWLPPYMMFCFFSFFFHHRM